MFIISLFGTIFVILGVILTIPIVCEKIHLNASIGWAIATIGMLMLSFSSFLGKNIIFGIVCLIFAMGDLYFCVTDSKD